MPVTSTTPLAVRVRFEPSVPAELLFLAIGMAGCEVTDQPPDADGMLEVGGRRVPEALARRVARFWDDSTHLWELFVIAEEAGTLVGPISTEDILELWDRACTAMPTSPSLRSESAHDRAVVRDRLERLRNDAGLRAAYLGLLADVWTEFEGDWETRWLPKIAQTIDDCRTRQARGVPWQQALQPERGTEVFEAGWERAREGGSAIVAVCAYGGSLVIDLPSTQFFALSIKSPLVIDRKRSTELARRLRAMSDPTRLALLQLLGQRPRTIGELATELDVAQPTVSNHVKTLREAGIVRSADENADRRALTVEIEGVTGLFGEVSKLLGGGEPDKLPNG
jgi:DNA-binding transcriptional ArsR family regulator